MIFFISLLKYSKGPGRNFLDLGLGSQKEKNLFMPWFMIELYSFKRSKKVEEMENRARLASGLHSIKD